MASRTFEKYGKQWKAGISGLSIELWCIKQGDAWLKSQGRSLFEHVKNTVRLLWPEDDIHRWWDLSIRTICENTVTTIMGPASSGKTYMASQFALVDYWADPEHTCVLVSSTELRGLELRVWGRLKELFNRATEKYPHLPGTVLESRHAIATDEIDEQGEQGRVLNKGLCCVPCLQGGRSVGLNKFVGVKQKRLRLIADECFPAGTLVDTPIGAVPIETLRAGDIIENAIGPSRIRRTMSRQADSLVRITTANGREIICTANHRVLTQDGWKCACHLNQSHYMVSAYEAMSILRKGVPAHKQQQGVSGVQGESGDCNLQGMRASVSQAPPERYNDVLRSILQFEVAPSFTRISTEVLHNIENQKDSGVQTQNVQAEPRAIRNDAQNVEADNGEVYEVPYARTKDSAGKAHQRRVETYRSQAQRSRRKWNRADEGRTTSTEYVPSPCEEQLPGQDRREIGQRIPDLLQSGCCIPGPTVGYRSGWRFPRHDRETTTRCKEDQLPYGDWVDRVEIYKPARVGRHAERERGIKVYNLEIEGHPSYSVNGFLVHNCSAMGPGFLDAISNLASNPDFKAVFLGNPTDPLDPLGIAAEPEKGWSSLPEPTKTTTWRTRFYNGTCVNLVGTDSPNFDYPQNEPPKFKYLTHRKWIEDVANSYGLDSQRYFSMAVGVMRTGLLARRVITRDLCIEHHALDKAVWSGSPRKKIYAIDAAYGGTGGDRCVGGWIEFGTELGGAQIIRVNPPVLIPVSIRLLDQPEDQIAAFVKHDTENASIPPEDVFYDSTGRGTLGAAFARLFGSRTPVPVEFGGKPSRRPVRHDLFVDDGHERRHKRCDEHYVDFVSELWMTSRYIIVCDQLRELPEEVMREGCTREYGLYNNKDFVESKHDPRARARMARSPDLYDWLVTAMEGARQRGFKIQKLGISLTEDAPDGWMQQEAEEYERALSDQLLTHT